MLPLAYFGIESSGLSLVVDLLLLFVVVLYLALIYWTYADACRRILDPVMIGCATAASLFPFVGTVVYVILRPPEYLEDVRERELEMQAAEARVHELETSLCPHCEYRVERDFLRCPSCLRKLRERCTSCSRPLDQSWTICPYCEADVPGIAPQRSRRRRTVQKVEPELEELSASVAAEGEDQAPAALPDPGASAPASASAAVAEPAMRPHSSSGRARRPRPSSS